MRTPQVNIALQKTLTKQRLEKYLAVSNNDLDTALKLYGVRPKGWTGLGGSFDRLPSVVVLELRGAQVAER